MISLLSTMRFDRYQIFPETRKGSLTNVFSTVRRETVVGKRWYPPPPILIQKGFFSREILKTEGFTYKIFRYCEKKFCGKLDNPLPIRKLFSISGKFWNTKKIPHKVFQHIEYKNFRRKMVIPRLLHKKFLIPEKNSEKQKSYFTKFFCFGPVRQKNFRQSCDAPFLCMKMFDAKKSLNYKRVHLWSFPVLREKKSPKRWYLFFLIHKNFSIPEIFETQKCSLTVF